MSTLVISVRGLEAHVNIEHGFQATSAWGIAFDEDADIVVETETRRFLGFCDYEIAYEVAGDMLAGRRAHPAATRGIEWADISAAIEALGHACDCEE